MARVASKDPLDKFRWAVSVDGFDKFGFTACDTPSLTINTKSYPEGGNHLYPKKIVDGAEYSPVTFSKGVTKDKSFHNWAKQVLEAYKLDKNIADYRRQVTIHHLDRQGRIVKSYVLYNAFPTEYKPASDFAADADDTLSLEKLVLTYESFEVITNEVNSNSFDSRDIVKRLINRN